MRVEALLRSVAVALTIVLAGCTGGGSNGFAAGGGIARGGVSTDGGCIGFCGDTPQNLTIADTQKLIAQAVQEANARGVTGTIAIVDRVGNVLAVFDMTATTATAPVGLTVRIDDGIANGVPSSGATLDGVVLTNGTSVTLRDGTVLPSANLNATGLAAVSKAITAAFLSSEGNAFTTRTAGQIIQENFNPGEGNQPSGPLFGVQFSNLACSDITSIALIPSPNGNIAPRASPLGLSADPGGLPLYKSGVPVGGIGVISDGIYGIDRNILDQDVAVGPASNDEAIALAGTFGYAAPADRRGDRITVDGKNFRFTDVELFDLLSNPAAAPAFTNAGATGRLVNVGVGPAATAIYAAGATPIAGQAFGQPASGIQSAASATAFAGQATIAARDSFILSDGAGTNRFPPTNSTFPTVGANGGLTQAEVITIISSALDVANSTRAQIRRPVNSQMRATVSVVDANGNILGIARTRDGPMFGTDVSLQKARTAVFFSTQAPDTAAALLALGTNAGLAAGTLARRVALAQGTAGTQDHQAVGATALTDGTAFADRSGGNLSRPFFPDGVSGNLPGPFSNPIGSWSPFATGLQLELVFGDIARILVGTVDNACAAAGTTQISNSGTATVRIANGIQIFPGSVPIYRSGALIGGIGVSGDGIDQDDMTSFLGLHNAGVLLGTGVGNAPVNIRADSRVAIVPFLGGDAINLRYVQCPQAPFLNSAAQNVCQGK